MIIGVILKGCNAFNFRNSDDFIFEFLPQLAFMICTFAYMIFLVIYKWRMNFEDENSSFAPSIIN